MTVTRAELEAIMNGKHSGANKGLMLLRNGQKVRVPQPGKRKDPVPSGHILPPGTGPEGETCKGCAHRVVNSWGKDYQKCGLNRANWTNGRKSDIRTTDMACAKWEKAG